ncbi:MAG: preprotein translocase subunit SecY [Oscillospiraceae bacterium]|nr:preprotein translocase subunit SecY [Oscillospiraceae bacterium]
MNGIFDTAVNAFSVQSLRKRLLYTFMILGLFMLGGLVPVPAIDGAKFTSILQTWGQLGSIMDLVSGGGLMHASILSMGVSPYINASIIIQLLTVVIPALEDMSKEGATGRKKMDKITRYSAIGLALVQSSLFCFSTREALIEIVPNMKWLSAVLVVGSFTAGAALVVFLGEKINDVGIGNGVSLIIFAGIATRLPDMARTLYGKSVEISGYFDNAVVGILVGIAVFILVTIVALVIIVFVIYVQDGERRIPVQYSKKVIGRNQRGGNKDYLPLKVNMSGVMPVIFSMSILAVPSIIVTMFVKNPGTVGTWIKNSFTGSAWYYLIYFVLIFAFTFFYSSINFHPIEIANNINQNGGTISGIRAGKPTSEFIKKTAFRLNWIEAFFLVLVCILPTVVGSLTGFENVWFAGTSVLIVTSVAADLIRQVEGELEVRSPKGFLEDLTVKKKK